MRRRIVFCNEHAGGLIFALQKTICLRKKTIRLLDSNFQCCCLKCLFLDGLFSPLFFASLLSNAALQVFFALLLCTLFPDKVSLPLSLSCSPPGVPPYLLSFVLDSQYNVLLLLPPPPSSSSAFASASSSSSFLPFSHDIFLAMTSNQESEGGRGKSFLAPTFIHSVLNQPPPVSFE